MLWGFRLVSLDIVHERLGFGNGAEKELFDKMVAVRRCGKWKQELKDILKIARTANEGEHYSNVALLSERFIKNPKVFQLCILIPSDPLTSLLLVANKVNHKPIFISQKLKTSNTDPKIF
jgi:hypothetical protein